MRLPPLKLQSKIRPQLHFAPIGLLICIICLACPSVGAAQSDGSDKSDSKKEEASQFFQDNISPFIKKHCLDCHSNRRPTEAGVSFTPALKSPGHAAFSLIWKKAEARIKAHDMPPEYIDEQPTDKQRELFSEWLTKVKYLSPKDPGPFVIRRLTKTEYGNTLHDLFGVDPSIVNSLPDEVSGEGYLNSLSPLQMEQYLTISQKVLEHALPHDGDSALEFRKKFIGAIPIHDSDYRASARKVALSFANKAYRRPPSESEIDVLLQVFELGRENELNYLASIRFMLKAALVSPQFLFITPAETSGKSGIVPLDDYQLASRLSYFLWSTMPDDNLMRLADQGKLQNPEILEAQVTRMLMDSRSRTLFDGFGKQWLGLDSLDSQVFDAEKFPEMTDELRTSMYDELRHYFQYIVRNNRSINDFIDSDYTFLNENLASIYGMKNSVSGSKMQKVQLTDKNRGGVMGMPGVLAATSFPNRTSAVKRGVWVLERILGEHVPPAPPDVPALEKQDQKSIKTLSLRGRTEQHRKDPVCANCHKILDPIGFGLENFDAIGRWRNKAENGEVIDAAGELPGGKQFTTPQELKSIIALQSDEFTRNLVERLLAFALCRNLKGYDELVVDKLMDDIAADNYKMQTVIKAVVTSYPFTHRSIQPKKDTP